MGLGSATPFSFAGLSRSLDEERAADLATGLVVGEGALALSWRLRPTWHLGRTMDFWDA